MSHVALGLCMCLSVYWSLGHVCCAKTAEQIEMAFLGADSREPKETCIGRGSRLDESIRSRKLCDKSAMYNLLPSYLEHLLVFLFHNTHGRTEWRATKMLSRPKIY